MEVGYEDCKHVIARKVSEIQCHFMRTEKLFDLQDFDACPKVQQLVGTEGWKKGRCYVCLGTEPPLLHGPCRYEPHILKDGTLPKVPYPTVQEERGKKYY
jgi:hypothetical protein